jgi:iron(III) transport system substrate-binding protein
MRHSFAKRSITLLLPALVFGHGLSLAQTNENQSAVAGIALYKGENRLQRLIEGAKKEGELTVYHAQVEEFPILIEAFTKKYGIKVKDWRSSSENVTQRVVTEAHGGRFAVDIVDNSGPGMEALHREKLLQRVESPYLRDLMPQALRPHEEWVATTYDVFVQGYNTSKIKKDDLPKTYQDLLDPKWKGRLGIEAEDQNWLATVLEDLGPEKGKKLFKDIVGVNGMSVRKGHSLLANLVASGEVPLALTLYNYKPEQLKKKGAPIDWFAISPVIAHFRGIGLAKDAPHPYAAMLFYDFMLNEGQQIYADLSHRPTNTRISTSMKKLELKFIDPARAIDLQDKWTQEFEEVITKNGKNK